MIRTFFIAIYLVFAFIWTLPSLIKANILEKNNKIKEKEELTNKVLGKIARGLMKASGSTVKVIGEENIPDEGPLLFVGNHQSNFDIPILIGYTKRNKGFIAKIELSKIPILSKWMEKLNCVFIDRNDVRQSLKAINKGVKHLKNGYSMVIFPEGTRSNNGVLGEFKPGSLKMATKARAAIVPVTIKGSYNIMSRDSLAIKPANVELIISKPIYINDENEKDSKGLTDKVRDTINKELNI